jgi:hypothetical protein
MSRAEEGSEYRGPEGPIEREFGDIDSIIEHAGGTPAENPEKEKKELDFTQAKNLADLYEMLRRQETIENSHGETYTAEQIITLIRQGALGFITNRGNLRDTVKLLFEDFGNAENMEDIYAMLDWRQEVVGKKDTFTASQIKDLIENKEYEKIPRTDGLRKKILALI